MNNPGNASGPEKDDGALMREIAFAQDIVKSRRNPQLYPDGEFARDIASEIGNIQDILEHVGVESDEDRDKILLKLEELFLISGDSKAKELMRDIEERYGKIGE
jgi:hypothetical protein